MKMKAALTVAALAVAGASGNFVAPAEHVLQNLGDVLPAAVSDLTATAVGEDRIFLFGGCLNMEEATDFTGKLTTINGRCTSVSNASAYFFPATGTVEQLPAAPGPRYRHGAAFVDGKVYVVGGVTEQDADTGDDTVATDVLVFDVASKQWEPTSGLALSTGFKDGTAFALNGKVYYAGGWQADWTPNANTVEIDPVAQTVTSTLPGFVVARGDVHSAVIGDVAYAVGGYADNGHTASVETFDGAKWTELAEDSHLRAPRGDKAVAAMSNRLYAFGGQVTSDGSGVQSIEVFMDGKWLHGGEMGEHRFRSAAAALGESVYVFGGAQNTTDTADDMELLASVLAYRETSGLYSMPTLTLHGSGTTNPSEFFWDIIEQFEYAMRVPAKISYRAVGSSTGQAEFVGNADNGFLPYTQFGSGDLPLTEANYQQVTRHGHEVAQFPFGFGAISVYVNIPELREVPGRIVVLKACTLAGIYGGDITNWKEIAGDHEENEWLQNVDQPIKAGHRTRGSSSTSGVTSYLHAECSDSWGEDQVGSALDSWPCASAGTCEAVQGSGGMQSFIQDNEYSLGYLSVGHGYPVELTEATFIVNDDEKVQATAEGIQAAASAVANVFPATAFEDFNAVNMIATNGPGAWPIVLTSYLYVRKDLTALGSSAALLKVFLEFVLNEEQGQSLMEEFDFVPLTDELRNRYTANIDELELPVELAGREFTFEDSTAKYEGAGPWVISSKRKSPVRAARAQATSAIDRLETQSSDIETRLAKVETIAGGASDDDHDHDADQTHAIAIAALIFAVVDFVILLFVLRMVAGIRSATKSVKKQQQQQQTRGPARSSSGDFSEDSTQSQSAAVRAVNLV